MKEIFSIANSQISFLQEKNLKLKVKQLIQSKPKPDLEEYKGKGKKIIDFDQMHDMEIETKPRRPKARGLKRLLELER